jgi:hypothetical protein
MGNSGVFRMNFEGVSREIRMNFMDEIHSWEL